MSALISPICLVWLLLFLYYFFSAQNVLSFYKLIRDPNEKFLPQILRGREETPKIDRLLSVYHSQKNRVNALMSRHVAIQFLNDLLEDMKRNLNPSSSKYFSKISLKIINLFFGAIAHFFVFFTTSTVLLNCSHYVRYSRFYWHFKILNRKKG